MLADAIRAEGVRLSRNLTALFWGLLFVPAVALAGSIIQTLFVHSQNEKIVAQLPQLDEGGSVLNLGEALAGGAAELANPLVLMFTAILAATLFAGDYRWETWRLITARNSRTNLLLGKLAVLGLGVLAGMGVFLAFHLVGGAVKGVVFDRPLGFAMDGSDLGRLLAGAGLGWLRIMQFLMLGLLAGTVTRSLLAALFVPLAIGVAQTFLSNITPVAGLAPDSWGHFLLYPAAGYDALLTQASGDPVAAAILTKAWTGLLLWTLAPLGAAIGWFSRQDLSKE